MPVYLSLGSNVGDRLQSLRAAGDMLRATKEITVIRESRVYETAPVGEADQDPFLNMAVEIGTSLAPLTLLDRTQAIERELGRVPTRRWGPRIIDIDIVLWEQLTLENDRLTIPHREFRNRAFVLVPLAEIAAHAVDPATGNTIEKLLGMLPSEAGVWLYAADTPNPTP